MLPRMKILKKYSSPAVRETLSVPTPPAWKKSAPPPLSVASDLPLPI